MTFDAAGRARIAETVKAAMGWKGVTGLNIDASGRLSRATLDRVKRRDPVSEAVLRALGDVLDLPRDFLLYIGRGDREGVESCRDVDPDLVRWALHLLDDDVDALDSQPSTT